MAADNSVLFFAGELAGLLTCSHDGGKVRYPVGRRASIKDVVEAVGVPHTEVYSISSGGAAHGFGLLLKPGMSVALLPADLSSSYPVDVTAKTLLRPVTFDTLRFMVDENVAGLVPLLRALGFDVAYDRSWDDEIIARLAEHEKRVVLSRSRALLKRTAVIHGRLIRSQVVDEQLMEVLEHFRGRGTGSPFSRCLRCNVVTDPVDKQVVLERLEPKTREHFHEFRLCSSCGRIYWRGSHHARLIERFSGLGIAVGPGQEA